ncbi:DUF58 domain-containing protein [Candidatus Sumerlaeota bacterium]|nr:DUF58 domain-containing protein [Candidatus Sumerlaeota bacterium]
MAETSLSVLQSKVRQIEIVSSRLVSEQLAGEYHSVFKGQGMEFEEVRPYMPGDEIRSIDWNVTARAGEPHVKRYREEREMTVFLVVDISASCLFGTRGEFKSDLIAEVCAVLAFATIANHDRVGLILCSDRLELVVPPRKGKRHTLRLVREVLGFRPAGRGTNLALALDHLRHVLHRKSVVFLLSDFFNINFEQSLAATARRHDLIAITVDDPMEESLPCVGLLDLVDAETGVTLTIDTADKRFLARYKAEQLRRRDAVKKLLLKHEVEEIRLKTGEAYAGELARFFRRRLRRAGR